MWAVNIYMESQAALKVLDSKTIKSRCTMDYFLSLILIQALSLGSHRGDTQLLLLFLGKSSHSSQYPHRYHHRTLRNKPQSRMYESSK